jgi:hypothetical protein
MGSRIVTVDNCPKDAVKVMTELKNKLNAENNRVMPRLRIPLPSTKLQQHWLQLCLAGLD